MSDEVQTKLKMQTTDDLERWVKTIEDRLSKINVTIDMLTEGQTQICHALELNGLMKAGEPTKLVSEIQKPQNPVDAVNFDVDKVVWTEPRDDPVKGRTWFASVEDNKTNADYDKLHRAMTLARIAKGNPEPFYFWVKRQFMWFDQNNMGIYRRQKSIHRI